MGKVKTSRFGYSNRLTGICIVILASLNTVIGELCTYPSDPCICKTSTFELNLKPLMEAMKGVDFMATGEGGDYTYYVQPCNRQMSSQIAACNLEDPNLVACQVYKGTTPAYGLGVMYLFEATNVSGNFVLINSYTSFNDFTKRQVELTIKCSDQEASFTYNGNNGPAYPIVYRFTLLTKYICGGSGINYSIDIEVGLSAGSVMVIIFFVVIVVYFVGGGLFQKFVKKAEGTEIIPNVSFWTALPSLAKDGVMFLVRGCKSGGSYSNVK
ncbi:hypothetical protein BsWGS_00601 [Bradybaena similaris]